jgi:hypothetical protein
MPRQGKGWLLVGHAFNMETANNKAKELAGKGFETSINQSTKTYRNKNWNTSQGPYKDIQKTVFKVWARDEVTKHRYKPDGRRRW